MDMGVQGEEVAIVWRSPTPPPPTPCPYLWTLLSAAIIGWSVPAFQWNCKAHYAEPSMCTYLCLSSIAQFSKNGSVWCKRWVMQVPMETSFHFIAMYASYKGAFLTEICLTQTHKLAENWPQISARKRKQWLQADCVCAMCSCVRRRRQSFHCFATTFGPVPH